MPIIYPKLNEEVFHTATALGCDATQADAVLDEMKDYYLPLNAKALVYQVVNAMEVLDLPVDNSDVLDVLAEL